MNRKNIEEASKIIDDIKTLEEEIKFIERICNGGSFSIKGLMRKLLSKKPTEKNYNGYWCMNNIDCINSGILINEREAMAVVEVKKKEIEELNKQIDELMGGGEDE